MMYKFNEKVSVKALADLRESVGWNRMEREYENPLLTSYYHIAVYEEGLKPFYERFGFYNMLCGQMETFSEKGGA